MLISVLLSEGSWSDKLILVAMLLIVIVVSLSFHEWAHAHAAHRMGDDTALSMGRMTINPLAHLEPLGFIMLLIVGFGWAKPVPVNPRNYKNYRLGEFTVSFAGIFTNLVIAFIAAFLNVGLAFYSAKTGRIVPYNLFRLLLYFGLINCSLAVFNFIPIYPLDGYHIFELVFGRLLGDKAIIWLKRNGTYIFYGVIALSLILSRTFGFSLISTVSNWIFNLFLKLFSILFSLIP